MILEISGNDRFLYIGKKVIQRDSLVLLEPYIMMLGIKLRIVLN